MSLNFINNFPFENGLHNFMATNRKAKLFKSFLLNLFFGGVNLSHKPIRNT